MTEDDSGAVTSLRLLLTNVAFAQSASLQYVWLQKLGRRVRNAIEENKIRKTANDIGLGEVGEGWDLGVRGWGEVVGADHLVL